MNTKTITLTEKQIQMVKDSFWSRIDGLFDDISWIDEKDEYEKHVKMSTVDFVCFVLKQELDLYHEFDINIENLINDEDTINDFIERLVLEYNFTEKNIEEVKNILYS